MHAASHSTVCVCVSLPCWPGSHQTQPSVQRWWKGWFGNIHRCNWPPAQPIAWPFPQTSKLLPPPERVRGVATVNVMALTSKVCCKKAQGFFHHTVIDWLQTSLWLSAVAVPVSQVWVTPFQTSPLLGYTTTPEATCKLVGPMVGSSCTRQICNFGVEAQPRHFSTVAKSSDKSPPSSRRTWDVCSSRQLLVHASQKCKLWDDLKSELKGAFLLTFEFGGHWRPRI